MYFPASTPNRRALLAQGIDDVGRALNFFVHGRQREKARCCCNRALVLRERLIENALY
jgi:hypothetical protein